MAGELPNLRKTVNHRCISSMNPKQNKHKKNAPRRIITKLLRTSDKILKMARDER